MFIHSSNKCLLSAYWLALRIPVNITKILALWIFYSSGAGGNGGEEGKTINSNYNMKLIDNK